MSRVSRRGKVAVALVFYALLSVFLVQYLRGVDWTQLASLTIDPVYLVLAVPLSLLPRMLQPIAWAALIRGYGEQPPPYPQIARVYATSWLGRYIPGKVAWIGTKIYLGQQHGVSVGTLATTAVAEAVLQLCTALALAFALTGLSARGGDVLPGDNLWLVAVVALVAMSVLLLPPVFNRLTAVARSFGRDPSPASHGRLSTSTLVTSGSICVVVHALSGVSVWLIVRAIYPGASAALIPELTAAVLFAGTLGTLAFFAPAGLGVREGALLVLLGLFIPAPVAVAAVVALRLWSIVMDVLFYAVTLLLDRRRPALC